MEHQFRDSQKDNRTALCVWTALEGEAWKPSAVTTRDRARRTAWVSEARWGPGWQDHSWLHTAPGSCRQGTVAVQNVMGNLLGFFFFFFQSSTSPSMGSNQTGPPVRYGMCTASLLYASGDKITRHPCVPWPAFWYLPGWLDSSSKLMDPDRVSVLRSSLGQTAWLVTI